MLHSTPQSGSLVERMHAKKRYMSSKQSLITACQGLWPSEDGELCVRMERDLYVMCTPIDPRFCMHSCRIIGKRGTHRPLLCVSVVVCRCVFVCVSVCVSVCMYVKLCCVSVSALCLSVCLVLEGAFPVFQTKKGLRKVWNKALVTATLG